MFVSSIKVNGEATLPGQPFTTDDAPAPLDAYGISRMEAELVLRELAAALVGKQDVAQRLCGSLQVDIEKTRRLLGWTPLLSLDEGLRRAAAGGMDCHGPFGLEVTKEPLRVHNLHR